jgi:transposase-like protein
MTRPLKFTPEKKQQIVLSVPRAELPAAEAGRRFATSETSVAKWRDLFVEGGVAALKNVERFSGLRPFRYQRARVHVEIERREPPSRIVPARYTRRTATDEPQHRLELLHRNILRYGTITNTLAAAGELGGTIRAEPPPAAAEQEQP